MAIMPIPESSAPLVVPRGDDRTYICTVTGADGDAVNITDATIKFAVQRDFDDGLILLFKSTLSAAEVAITDPTGGVFKLYLIPTDTTDMADSYKFSIEIALSSGKSYTPITGDFIVTKTVP